MYYLEVLMADILTHLRELSFGLGFYELDQKILKIPSNFLNFCLENIANCKNLELNQISLNGDNFNENELEVIQNGIKLSNYIKNKLFKDEKFEVEWIGNHTQSGSPVDIIVNKKRFSLKENSFILTNMGLYQLLNIVTNSNKFEQGVNIFEQYSKKELEYWFNETKSLLIDNLSKSDYNFEYSDKKGKKGKILLKDEILFLSYNGNECKIENFTKCTYDYFKIKTTSEIREKTFSKFISNKLSKNPKYLEAKKKLC